MSFDQLAPHYRWLEAVLAGNKLQRCRTAFLEAIPECQQVLICGEGHGRFLTACRRRLPRAQITCLDASSQMLAIARARLQRSGLAGDNIAFRCCDILNWAPPQQTFDLLVTHFFLDCFTPDQLKVVTGLLGYTAQAKAHWLLADFQIPRTGLARIRAQLIHRVMYGFFRRATRISATQVALPTPYLEQIGFSLRATRVSEWGLLHTDLWERTAFPATCPTAG